MDIYSFLKKHCGISFHMPAHKNRVDFIYNDITEIFGADNLRNPKGIIKCSQKRASEIFNAKKAYYLVNGASSGLLSSMLYLGNQEIAVDRNCHESVINGLVLSGGIPHYIYPETDSVFEIPKPVSEKDFDNVSKLPFVYTAATYYGKTCNTKALRKKTDFMIADEAHGSHFYFSDELKRLCASEADISILSFHKSLPALTQTAVMLCRGNKTNSELLERCKNSVTTTSPSYPLMASLDYAISNGFEAMKSSKSHLISDIKKEISERTDFLVYESDDPWKILINFKNSDAGAENADKYLRENYGIYTEGVFGNNLLLMLSPYNTEEEILLLKDVLVNMPAKKIGGKKISCIPTVKLKAALTPREAFFSESEIIPTEKSPGRTAAENITLFPPCVPIITLGETITHEAAFYIASARKTVSVVK